MRWTVLVALLACALAAEDGDAWLHADGLRLELRPLALQPRPDAPWWLEAVLADDDGRLRTGRLSLTLRSGNAVMASWSSGDLAVAGRRRALVVLPPLPAADDEISVLCEWTAADGRRWNLGERPLGGGARPAPVLGVVAAGQLAWGHLLPEPEPAADGGRPGRRLQAMRIPSDLLPQQPLAWCACDAVLVAPAEAAAVRGPEAEALAAWVRLGGRLALLDTPPAGCALAGLLPVLTGTVTPCGLGLVVRSPDATTAGTAQRALWGPAASRAEAEVEAAQTCSLLTTELWPDRVATVPIAVLVAIAGLFALAIGPGEWFVLGWLRRRRWTWFTFPLLAAAATAATVLAARHYLGSGSHARTLTIADVDAEGAVRRTSAITLHFRGAAGAIAIDGRGTLAAAFSTGQRRHRYIQEFAHAQSIPLAAEGQVPGRWTASVPIPQWSPVFVRTLAAGGGAAPRLALRQGSEADLLRAAREADPEAEAAVVGPDAGRPGGGGHTLPVRLTRAAGGRPAAPSGGADLSDLALLGIDDPAARVVLLIRRHGPDLTVFRYPCRTTP